MNEMTRISQGAKLERVRNLAVQMAIRNKAPLLASYLRAGEGCGKLSYDFKERRVRVNEIHSDASERMGLGKLFYLKSRLDTLQHAWASLGGRIVIVSRSGGGGSVSEFPFFGYSFVSL